MDEDRKYEGENLDTATKENKLMNFINEIVQRVGRWGAEGTPPTEDKPLRSVRDHGGFLADSANRN